MRPTWTTDAGMNNAYRHSVTAAAARRTGETRETGIAAAVCWSVLLASAACAFSSQTTTRPLQMP
jgi:hypothetical protein